MKLQQIRKSAWAWAAALLLGLPTSGMATIVGSSDPLLFSWSYDTGTSLLTGYGSMTVSGFNSGSLTLGISLTNTSSIGGIGGERLTSFGFGVDPNASGVSFSDSSDGGMTNAVLGATFPAVQGVDVCAIGGTTCAGGSNGGIYAGTSDSFTVVLSGSWGSSVNIDPIAFKYQTGYGSFEFTSSSSSSSSSGSLPEPASASLVGLGLGMLGIGFVRRRKQNR